MSSTIYKTILVSAYEALEILSQKRKGEVGR